MKTRFTSSALLCSICYSHIEIQGKLDTCRHEFCSKCIERWSRTQNTCPICIKRFHNIKRVRQRLFYSRVCIQEELTIVTKDQGNVYISLEEYLRNNGLVQGRDFVFLQRA